MFPQDLAKGAQFRAALLCSAAARDPESARAGIGGGRPGGGRGTKTRDESAREMKVEGPKPEANGFRSEAETIGETSRLPAVAQASRRTLCTYYHAYIHIYIFFLFFSGVLFFSIPTARLCSRSRPRGTQGVRLYTTVQVWVPGGLRGACSGRSKSRNLASNHGIAF